MKSSMMRLLAMTMIVCMKPNTDAAAGGTNEELPVTGAVGEGAPEVKKEKQLIPDIIRGRMPIAVVAQVRFGANKDGAVKALATLYGTTVGKIDDIKKNRNFAYVTDAFKPTAAQKAEGIAWLQKHVAFDKGAVDALIVELEKAEEPTAEEAAAFSAVKTAARGQNTTTKTGEVADAGGGNNIKGNAKKNKAAKVAPAEGTQAASADDLLS
jgi:hypothetical protein